jgi:hypothetical protein
MSVEKAIIMQTPAVEVAQPPAGGFATDSSRTLHAALGIAALGVLLIATLLHVEEGSSVVVPLLNRALPELCYWRVMFGMDCPGCGLTRCFISAAHGDLAAAWDFNPMGLLLFAALLFQIPYRPWQFWRISSGRGEFQTIGLPYAMLGISVLLILQWFWRLML